MKYSISVQNPLSLLRQADEVRIYPEDIPFILPKTNEFLNTRIYIYTKPGETVARAYNFAPLDFILAQTAPKNTQKVPFTNINPVGTYYDLRKLAEIAPTEILIGGDLLFNLPQVKEIVGDIPLRVRLNQNTIYTLESFFIRPEDVEAYDKYISLIELPTGHEKTFFDTYKKQKWNGNLRLLFPNLDICIDNRIFPEDFAQKRLECRRICMETGNCHYCQNIKALHDSLRERT